MTVLHTGSTKKFADNWTSIFAAAGKKKPAQGKKSTAKKPPRAAKKSAAKKTARRK